MASPHRPVIDALKDSNAELAEVTRSLASLDGPSYCREWTLATVLKHLGSGAAIGLLNLLSALAGGAPPPRSRYGELIGEWAAKGEGGLVTEVLEVNDRYISTLDALTDDELDALRVHLRGRDLDASVFAGRRLFEHALHTWDLAVMADPGAVVVPAAAELLVGRVLGALEVYAHGEAPPSEVRIAVFLEGRPPFTLRVEPTGAGWEPGDASAQGRLSAAPESFVRLVTGRLDNAHTPASLTLQGVADLGMLRSLFAGAPTPTEP